MTFTDDHERAQQAAALLLSGDGSPDERAWLASHLSACPECVLVTAGLEHALAALRSISLPVSPALVAATQRRVREEASRLEEKQNGRRLLALSSLVVACMTGAAGISLWHVLGWLANRLAVAPVALTPVLLALWFLPGILAGAAAWASQGPDSPSRRADRVFEQRRPLQS